MNDSENASVSMRFIKQFDLKVLTIQSVERKL